MAITLIVCVVTGIAAVCCYRLFRLDPMRRRRDHRCRRDAKKVVYAFFHPHASGGGGGERVLWKMIQFLQSSSHRSLRCGEGESEGFAGIGQSNPINNKETQDGNRKDNGDGDDNVEIIVFTIDPPSTNEHDLRLDAERRFGVSIPRKVRLVSLEEYKDYLSPRPFLSLVMESWGTMKLARRALMAPILDEKNEQQIDKDCEFVFCDTTGCAFTFAVVRWMCPPTTRILAYVHYPTISTDMMMWEWQKTDSNASIKRWIKTVMKLGYYYLFSVAYGLCGSLADLVMVNSTWTYDHIQSLWRFRSGFQRRQQPIQIVYPPCRVPSIVDNETSDDHDAHPRENTIISIGQFRPEKNHKLQIQALSVLLKTHPELRIKQSDTIIVDTEPSATSTGSNNSNSNSPVKLLLIGSCRNESDRARVDELRQLVEELGLQDHVSFNINPPYRELQASMVRASIGIHTMRQEHFGIGIVEMMASGLLTIAHDSGGPKSDIVLKVGRGGTGFLATTMEQYAEAMHKALTLDEKEARVMRQKSRRSATRFSDEAFDKTLERVLPLLYC
jgi:alpha-1,2-mannosyltransferase